MAMPVAKTDVAMPGARGFRCHGRNRVRPSLRCLVVVATVGVLLCAAGCVTERGLEREPDFQVVDEKVPAGPPLRDDGSPKSLSGPTRDYVVQKGDTLWRISQRMGIPNWSEILDRNPGLDPARLPVGHRIHLPAASRDAPAAAPPPIVPDKDEPDPTPEAKSAGRDPRDVPAPSVRRNVAEKRFLRPVRGRVACRYGQVIPWAPHIINRGVIFDVAPGSRVRASKSGVAFVMRRLPGAGRTVAIDHGDGTATTYGFNSRILVKHGDFVRQGQAVAVAGSSGRAKGSQVYFRIDRPRGPVDPLLHLDR